MLDRPVGASYRSGATGPSAMRGPRSCSSEQRPWSEMKEREDMEAVGDQVARLEEMRSRLDELRGYL
jgi:hypothetical protein